MTAAEEFNAEIAAQALARIANGEVPSEFCTKWDANVPDNAASIELWAKADPMGFGEELRAAKKIGARVMVAECVKIADCQHTRPEHKKIKIDARMKLAALWNPAECNAKQVIEQTTTVRNVTAKEAYVQDMVQLFCMSPEQAASQYDSARPIVAMIR